MFISVNIHVLRHAQPRDGMVAFFPCLLCSVAADNLCCIFRAILRQLRRCPTEEQNTLTRELNALSEDEAIALLRYDDYQI